MGAERQDWADLEAQRTGEAPEGGEGASPQDIRWLADLAADLAGSEDRAPSGDWPIDGAVLAAAHAASRRARARRLRPLALAAGVAAAAVVGFLAWPSPPGLADDFNGDQRVDVVDALLMSESIEAGEQRATAAQVERLMERLVRLEGEG